MTKPSFTVCCIVRNGARTLPRLFESLDEFRRRDGEIVVMDTGSRDQSVMVARSFGADVTAAGERFMRTLTTEEAKAINERFVVDNEAPVVQPGSRLFNFSAARNACAALAKTDWVTWADSDEAFTKLDIDEIEKVIADPKASNLEYEFVFAHDPLGRPAVQFIQSKMYRRSLMQWTRIVHEVLGPLPGEAEGRERRYLPPNIFFLEHYQEVSDHRANYLPGLAVDCFEDPKSDRNSHYLARELFWTHRHKSAIKEFQRHLAMGGWPAERAQSLVFMGDCHGAINHAEHQVELYQRAFNLDPTRRVALLRLAGYYKFYNKYAQCAAYAAAALQIPYHGFYANDMAEYRELPHAFLYWANGWLGNIPGAQEHLLKALEYQPYHPDFLRDTRFYFEYPDQGIEGWMRYPELTWLYQTAKTAKRICEVGSWKGRSTHALLSGAAKGAGGTVWAVDHFGGSADVRDGTHGADANAVYEQFIKNTAAFHDNLIVHRADSAEAANEFPDGYFDLIFVDAEHTESGVRGDVAIWRPKVKIGGILAGHDFSDAWPSVMAGVREALGGEPDEIHDSIWVHHVTEPAQAPTHELPISPLALEQLTGRADAASFPLVSIVIPSLGREQKLQRLLAAIGTTDYPHLEVIVEHDSFENRQGVPKTLKRGVERAAGEFICYLGNDCVPGYGFLRRAMEAMRRAFPLMDGLVGLNDGVWGEQDMATHWVASRKLLPMLGGDFFHLGYHHVACDNELTERCRLAGKYVWAKDAKIFHDHLSTGAPMDEVYKLAWDPQRVQEDRDLLVARGKQLGFPVRVTWRQKEATYDPAGNTIEGMMSPDELKWLYDMAKQMNTVVEIGSWKGRSTHALLAGCRGTVHSVDHFKGSADPIETGHQDVYDDFMRNVGQAKNLVVHRTDSLSAAREVADDSVDAVFVDGGHQYHEVLADIRAWLPKAKKLICGHDIQAPAVLKAVEDTLGRVAFVDRIWFLWVNHPLEWFRTKIERNENFSFVKLGDGEQLAMQGAEGANCDGHPYSPELAVDLKRAFRYFGTRNDVVITKWKFGLDQELVKELGVNPIGDHDLFLHRVNEITPSHFNFYRAVKLSQRKKIFVGPARLRGVIDFLNIDEFIEVPEVNAYATVGGLSWALNSQITRNAIFLFSAGMPAKIMIANLLRSGTPITCIDLGSALDPLFVGQTRTNQLSREFLQEYYKALLTEQVAPNAPPAPIAFKDFPQETHPERLFVVDRIGDPNGLEILDLGCGQHKTIPEAIGIDIEPGADVQGSIDRLNYYDGSVDVIISRHSLEHVLDPIKALKEWRRVLKPGGRIIIVLPDHGNIDTMHPMLSSGKHLHAYSRESFTSLVELCGLVVEEMITVVDSWSFGAVLRKPAAT